MNLLSTILAQSSSGGSVGGAIGGILFCGIYLAVIILVVAGLWKTFEKAGQPGWAAIVPIYNGYIMCKIAGRPGWWVVLLLIPLVSLIVGIIVMLDLAKSFGKSVAFAVGLILLGPIFICMLGFGSAQYQGPAAANK